MKILFLFLILTTSAIAEDQIGYVLRHNYWGVDTYWVHDGSKWGYPDEPYPTLDKEFVRRCCVQLCCPYLCPDIGGPDILGALGDVCKGKSR